MEFLRDENHPQRVQLGPSRLHSLVSAGQTHRSAARVFDVDGDSPVAGTVRFNWDPLRWFEEDEPIYGHPRNPYPAGRCAALAPTRPCQAGRHCAR